MSRYSESYEFARKNYEGRSTEDLQALLKKWNRQISELSDYAVNRMEAIMIVINDILDERAAGMQPEPTPVAEVAPAVETSILETVAPTASIKKELTVAQVLANGIKVSSDMTPRNRYECYDCYRCQKTHFEDEPIYAQHIGFQSKHGRSYVTAEVRWFGLRNLFDNSEVQEEMKEVEEEMKEVEEVKIEQQPIDRLLIASEAAFYIRQLRLETYYPGIVYRELADKVAFMGSIARVNIATYGADTLPRLVTEMGEWSAKLQGAL